MATKFYGKLKTKSYFIFGDVLLFLSVRLSPFCLCLYKYCIFLFIVECELLQTNAYLERTNIYYFITTNQCRTISDLCTHTDIHLCVYVYVGLSEDRFSIPYYVRVYVRGNVYDFVLFKYCSIYRENCTMSNIGFVHIKTMWIEKSYAVLWLSVSGLEWSSDYTRIFILNSIHSQTHTQTKAQKSTRTHTHPHANINTYNILQYFSLFIYVQCLALDW